MPAAKALAHWHRLVARCVWSDLASRLIGLTPLPSLDWKEQQEDWDLETNASSAPPAGDERFDYARAVGDRALDCLRSFERPGPRLVRLAEAMAEAVKIDHDPDYYERIFTLERETSRLFRERMTPKTPLPSPAVEQLEARIESAISSINWEKKGDLGAVYAVVADRLVDLELTSTRLGCLTGATKRLGVEGRSDERAILGFLRQLTAEARAGLALLDQLELLVAEIAEKAPPPDPRSSMPEICYGLLLLPAVDAKWLETALGIHERVAQKSLKKLSDLGIIEPWDSRRVAGLDGRSRDVQLWVPCLVRPDKDLPKKTGWKHHAVAFSLQSMDPVVRYRDIDISVPMSVVFARHEETMVDIDKQFGRFWEDRLGKRRRPPFPARA